MQRHERLSSISYFPRGQCQAVRPANAIENRSHLQMVGRYRRIASARSAASVLRDHDGVEEFVARCGALVGPPRMEVAQGDGGLAARHARVQIEDADAVTADGVAAR